MKNTLESFFVNADNIFRSGTAENQITFFSETDNNDGQLSMFDGLDFALYSADIYGWEADINTKTVTLTVLPGGKDKSVKFDELKNFINQDDSAKLKKQFDLKGAEERRIVDADIRLRCGSSERIYRTKGTVFRSANGNTRAAGVAYDAASTKMHLEFLEYLKTHDYLTGLDNMQVLEKLSETKDCLYPCSFVIACIDNLREINDSLGYFAGNDLIRNVAEVIKECFSDSDFTVRLGGGEFCAVFSGKDALEIEMMIKEATMMIHKTYLNLIKTEVSFGYSISDYSNDLPGMYRQAAAGMKRSRNLRKILSSESVVDRLNDIISAKAGWGKRHIRLQSLAAQIGAEMGCGSEQISEIKALAKIADLGFLGVSDGLLKSAAYMSEDEKAERAKHAETGRLLIEGISELCDMEPLYLDVFKRYDEWQEGIALPARIVAGAVGFDDISLCGGPVRIKDITAYMESQKGIRYCPKVVNAIVKITNKHLLGQYGSI